MFPLFELVTFEIIAAGHEPVLYSMVLHMDDFLCRFRRFELYKAKTSVHRFLGTVSLEFHEADFTEKAEVVAYLLGSEAGLDATYKDDILRIHRHV